MSIARACLAATLIACTAGAVRAQPAQPALAPLARSAVLTVDAAPAAGGLTLRVRHSAEQTPLAVNDVSVAIDGKREPATARPDGSWFVPRPAGALDAGKTIEVTVGHDGIHEVLTGRLAAAVGAPDSTTSRAATAVSGSHKQIVWWILNIAIVLIAAIAISRRMS